MEEIARLRENGFDISKLSSVTLVRILDYARDVYYNSGEVPSDSPQKESMSVEPKGLSDPEYDYLLERLKQLSPQSLARFDKTGAEPCNTKNKVRLPFHMGSMDKIKPGTGFLDKWVKKYNGNGYNISEKLDGVSGLFLIVDGKKNLYTRGSGLVGSDISMMIPYIPNLSGIEIPEIDGDGGGSIVVRGELIISKMNFEKYIGKTTNARNMASGLVNSKTLDLDKINDLSFVAYEYISDEPMSIIDQFEKLYELGFEIVNNTMVEELSDEVLDSILVEQRENSPYEIDGLIVTDCGLHERNLDGNPEYAFAFKNIDPNQVADVRVIEVEWNISKDGLYKPRLHLETTFLSGANISYVTAHNAKFIVDNSIGPDTIIRLVRSGEVIPHILCVVQGTEAQMPPYNYIWNSSKVDIMMDPDNPDSDHQDCVNIKTISLFFKKLGIKHLGECTIEKIYNAGYDTISAILSASIDDLCHIQGIQNRLATKLYNEIQAGIVDVELSTLMAASNIFGHGLGGTVSSLVLKEYPELMDMREISISDLKEISGVGPIRAKQFVDRLPKFKEFLETIPMVTWKVTDFPEFKPIKVPSLRSSPAKSNSNSNSNSNPDDIDLSELSFTKIGGDGEEYDDEQDSDGPVITNELQGRIVVFSGFRNKNWEYFIQQMGGMVKTSFVKNTSLVIVKDFSKPTAKITKAQEDGIEVVLAADFAEKYNLGL